MSDRDDWPEDHQPKGYPDDFDYTITQENGYHVIFETGKEGEGRYVASTVRGKDILEDN